MHVRRFWRRSRLVAALVAAALLLWAYRVLAVWNDRPTVFLAGFAGVFALLLIADWVFDLVGPPVWRLARSLALSVGRAVARDPEVEGLLDRHPRFGGWLRRRLTLERWSGLYLTAIVVLAGWLLAGFLSILRGVLTTSSLATYDPQIAALLRAFRTPAVTRVLWVATVFGDPASMLAVSAVFVLLLLLWGRRGEAVLVAVTMAVGATLGDFLKLATSRPRPPLFYALIRGPASKSFPSGHALASLLFFALLAFVLWRTTARSARARFAVVVLCAAGALTVALSRVYLGVHWPTDILGSWYLGGAWFTVTAGAFLVWERYGTGTKRWPAAGTARDRTVATAAVAGAALTVLVVGAQADPLLGKLVSPPPPVPYASTGALLRALPRNSEKLDGSPQEPVSLVFAGTEAELTAAFAEAGWVRADPPTIGSVTRATAAAIADRPYPAAPVTPAFLAGKANDAAFERAEGRPTVRRRHHARFWSTNLELDGEPVWVGTASFDTRLEIGEALPFPTHHIDPEIDRERSLVAEALLGTGRAGSLGTYRLSGPRTGTNAAGDVFHTDGRVVMLEAR